MTHRMLRELYLPQEFAVEPTWRHHTLLNKDTAKRILLFLSYQHLIRPILQPPVNIFLI